MSPLEFHPDNFQHTPDTTQRSIIEQARKQLANIEVSGDVVRIPVMRDMSVFQPETPQEWDKPSYVVTFRREGSEWQPVSVE